MPSRITSRTYATVSPEQQKEMTGLEFVQGLADGTLPLNTIAEILGYDIAEAESGRVVVTAEPEDIHLNPAGTVHGGLAATMLDSCMGLAIQSTLGKGNGSTTLEFKISFIRPITPNTGPIMAVGTVINCDTGGEFRRPSDQATICRAANCEMRVFAERVSLCHSATLTRLTATAVMTCCKRVFANPM